MENTKARVLANIKRELDKWVNEVEGSFCVDHTYSIKIERGEPQNKRLPAPLTVTIKDVTK